MKSVKKYQLKSWVKKTLLGLLIIGTMPFVYSELVEIEKERQQGIDYCVNVAGLSYEYCESRI